MLVLSRKQNEELLIGDNIAVTVLEVRGNVVRLGIQAPRDIRVLRGELATWHAPACLVECGQQAVLAG
jgi:carbon storage regulator CsrA